MIGSCRKCGKETELPYKGKRICRPCNAEYMREWNAKNRDKQRANKRKSYRKKRKDPGFVEAERRRGREYWRGKRHEAIMAYGGYRCQCCGETEPKFLTIDHVNNDGGEHRKEIGKSNSALLTWLKGNGYPSGFQVLCFNCNIGKSLNNGICPHKS